MEGIQNKKEQPVYPVLALDYHAKLLVAFRNNSYTEREREREQEQERARVFGNEEHSSYGNN